MEKKTTTKPKKTNVKSTTKKVEKENNIEIKEQEVKKDIKQEEKTSGRISKKFRKSTELDIDPQKKVPVVSMVSYPVGYQCKLSPKFIKWNDYGDEHYMTVEELQMLNSEDESFLHEPTLMVDDEEFAEAFNLTGLYETIFELDDLDTFYKQRVPVVRGKIDNLSNGTRKNLFMRTLTLITQGKLNNLAILRMLRDVYHLAIEI